MFWGGLGVIQWTPSPAFAILSPSVFATLSQAVQSIVSLMKLLDSDSLGLLVRIKSRRLILFVLRKCEKLLHCKISSHICQQNKKHKKCRAFFSFYTFVCKTYRLRTNSVVSFEELGPDCCISRKEDASVE